MIDDPTQHRIKTTIFVCWLRGTIAITAGVLGLVYSYWVVEQCQDFTVITKGKVIFRRLQGEVVRFESDGKIVDVPIRQVIKRGEPNVEGLEIELAYPRNDPQRVRSLAHIQRFRATALPISLAGTVLIFAGFFFLYRAIKYSREAKTAP